MKSKYLLPLGAALCSLFTAVNPLHAQGTAFTYNGRLSSGSNVANGSYDLTFTLFNAVSGPAQVGTTLTNGATAVNNGLFTVALDFGANFPGADRWLEVAVRTNDTGAFTNLAPRQKIAATPYAITASNLTGTLPAGQLSGALPSAQLAGTYGGAVTFNNAANSFTGSGGGLTSLNASQLASGTVADARLAANVARTNQVWLLGGNAGTTPGTHFLGTTDNQPVEIKANGLRALRLETPAIDANHSNIVNVIGGSANNSVGAGFYGATVAGGGAGNYFGLAFPNRVTGHFGTIGGGRANLSGNDATVSGGQGNSSLGPSSTIGGGLNNTNNSNTESGTIGGGEQNSTTGNHATIGGGYQNVAGAGRASVGGGYQNTNASLYGTIGGGYQNLVNSNYATVGGGGGNRATDDSATVSGGQANRAGGSEATVSGGRENLASGGDSTVGGGFQNLASGYSATVPGGENNHASGAYSFAAGHFARATKDGAFVWADSQGIVFTSTAADQFLIRAQGGVGIGVNNPQSTLHVNGTARIQGPGNWDVNSTEGDLRVGDDTYRFKIGVSYGGGGAGDVWMRAQGGSARLFLKTPGGTTIYSNEGQTSGVSLATDGTAWAVISDRKVKKDIAPVDQRTILEKLAALPITQWHYQWESSEVTPHIGPMAQDFKAAFYPGTDDKSITTQEADGVALAAIQGLNQKVEEQRAENAELKQRLEKLERLLNEKNGGGR